MLAVPAHQVAPTCGGASPHRGAPLAYLSPTEVVTDSASDVVDGTGRLAERQLSGSPGGRHHRARWRDRRVCVPDAAAGEDESPRSGIHPATGGGERSASRTVTRRPGRRTSRPTQAVDRAGAIAARAPATTAWTGRRSRAARRCL